MRRFGSKAVKATQAPARMPWIIAAAVVIVGLGILVIAGGRTAPQSALGGNFLQTEWPDVAATLQASTYSLKALAMATLPLMDAGGAIVGMDFDAQVAWPGASACFPPSPE